MVYILKEECLPATVKVCAYTLSKFPFLSQILSNEQKKWGEKRRACLRTVARRTRDWVSPQPQVYIVVTFLHYIKSDGWSLSPPAQGKIDPSHLTLRFQVTVFLQVLSCYQVVIVPH